MKIPFLAFNDMNRVVKEEILTTFENFLDSNWYILGNYVKQFEDQYAKFNNVKHCIGVSNGLDALHISLKALGIGKGDEVLVPSNTYIATVLAISYVGAMPKFVEPDIRTYNINPDLIEAAITPATKAIMPVHLYGQACEMEKIMAIAKRYNLFVIEDNAQSQGATYRGRMTGNWGVVNGTSFYPGKNLGAFGDAGAVTTDDDQLGSKIMALRNYGSHKKYHNDIIGFNMRLDECQAGFLSVKLKHLNNWTEQRRKIAALYHTALDGIGDLILPETAEGADHVYHLYVIRTNDRDDLQSYLQENGIGTLIHYPIPPHLQPAYKHLGYRKGSFPLAEKVADTCLSIPLWPGMTELHISYVQEKIKAYFNA